MQNIARACWTWALLAAVGCGSAAATGEGGNQAGTAAGGATVTSAGGAFPDAGNATSGLAGTSAAGAVSLAGNAGSMVSTSAGGGSAGSAGGVSSNGGASAGSTGGGGATSCDWSPAPANVAAWVDESWKSQLGSNIRSRRAWNLDNVMMNKGEMNLCVRWGATSAVPAAVRMNLASTVQRWFNDWFKALGNYGCFPYATGITIRITGWAVKPGQQALLSGIDPTLPVYTETDSDGEPQCPDACSSFVHWDHQFPNCEGGPANHSDYWLWFDDALPGNGGAAAVGGDWGLRMPVSTFVDHFNDASFLICEHEMGHGFGFQDYYTWSGSTPAGGSLMIVGSTVGKQSPTVGDTWLIRRTWQEMRALRSW